LPAATADDGGGGGIRSEPIAFRRRKRRLVGKQTEGKGKRERERERERGWLNHQSPLDLAACIADDSPKGLSLSFFSVERKRQSGTE
jgi:hypothetical protein